MQQTILIIDDSKDDILITKRVLSKIRPEIRTEVASSGNAGLTLLRDAGELPALILLDLKMPVKDGFEVLQWLQTHYFAQLVVVALTDSMRVEHIKSALDLGADLFQVKPRSPREYETMMLALEDHWLSRLPAFAAAERLLSLAGAR